MRNIVPKEVVEAASLKDFRRLGKVSIWVGLGIAFAANPASMQQDRINYL